MVREGWVESGGVRLHYLEWPLADPAEADGTDLFLLHGLSANARYWERLAERFPHRRVVALDQRAHGASDRPPDGYSPDALAADAAAAIQKTGLARPLVAGHSWGCTTALAVAAGSPDLVSGLAVFDGPVQPMSERLEWSEVERMMQPPLPRYGSLEEAYARARTYVGDAWGADLEPGVAAGFVREGDAWVLPLTAEVRHRILREMYDFQPQLLWASLAMPALAAFAGADAGMRAWKEQVASTLAKQAPGVDIRWYPTRHDIPQIAPDAVAADLERVCLEAGFVDFAERLREAVESGAELGRPALADWSGRELLIHLVSTQSALAAVVRAPSEPPDGSPRAVFDSDRWNASQVRRRAETPVPAILDELDAGTAELRAALRGVSMDKVLGTGSFAGRTVASGMRAMLRHQRGHLEELEDALAG